MIKKLLIGWGIVSIISIFIYSVALAAPGDLGITYTPDPGGGLFSQINMKPLDAFTKEVIVKNKSSEARKFALKIDQLVGYEPLAHVLTLDISRGGVLILSKHLSDFLNTSIPIEDIPGNTTYVYGFKVTMDNVGNEYQAREIKSFNYVFGFEGEPGEVAGEKTGLPETGPSILITIFVSGAIYLGLKKKLITSEN
jgi:hypothetical protein